MKKKIAVILAFITAVCAVSGCNSDKTEGDTTTSVTEQAATGMATDPTKVSADNFETWKGIDGSTVIAEVKGENASDKFKVTFDDFYGEYLYYLVSYGIADDMAADTKTDCEGYRYEIIDYLTFEKQFMHAAETKYNCGINQLTEEEKAEIKKNADEVVANWKANYYDAAAQLLGAGATDEQIDAKCGEMLDSDLARCKLTTDVFYKWEQSSFILEKLTQAVTAEVTLDRSEAEEMYNDYYNAAVEAYNNDRASYEQNPSYTSVYVPEGTRASTHLFVPFDEETTAAIAEKRKAGLDAEADELRKTAADGAVTEKLMEGLDKLINLDPNNTEYTYADVLSEYNPEGLVEYFTVVPDTKLYYPEYHEALFGLEKPGEISTPVLCDNGAYVILYTEDVVLTEEDIADTKDSMYEFLLSNKQQARQTELIEEWDEEFPFYVNYELLKLTPPEETEAETETTTVAE